MENNFLKILKQKLSLQRSSDFDKVFWNKFDKEFKSHKSWNWKILMPAIATSALVITLFITKKEFVNDKSDLLSTNEILESQEMLQDMDFFVEFDDIATDDADWAILLEGEDNS